MLKFNVPRPCLAALLISFALPAFAGPYDKQALAAKTTATKNSACTAISPFYWEIGDGNSSLASGSVGLLAPNAKTPMTIYSASKWLYAAYLVSVRNAQGTALSPDDIAAMTMTSGYNDQGACALQPTVAACLSTIGTRAETRTFFYGPGHFEKSASDLGLGALTSSDLAAEISRKLGGMAIGFQNPNLAAGGITSASEYAGFLRKVMYGTYLPGLVGSNRVCTYTGPTVGNRTNCPTAGYSPGSEPASGLQEAWDYSLGHWVENDPVNSTLNPLTLVDAYSSPGAAGFYPWIDSTNSFYGIVARSVLSETSAAKSVICGRKIRKAWMTGQAQ